MNILNKIHNINHYQPKNVITSLRNLSLIHTNNVIKHDNYEIINHEYINEYNVEATLYQHIHSKSEILSVYTPHENNKVFGITFRTPALNDKGLAHIMEHSVLCGSKKYPIKDPFVQMLKGSLQTFLNAFTYQDRTVYPVASQNLKDYYNLVDIYMDAVLFPNAVEHPWIFKQEGWHYELKDESSPLFRQGVVLNEMKGVYSQPDALLSRDTFSSLYNNNHPYYYDSGGDPKAIPLITFNEFKEFHQHYYNPANARVFFYGNDPLEERLNLYDNYMKQYMKHKPIITDIDTSIKFEKSFDKPKYIETKYPCSENQVEDHHVTINWVLNHDVLPVEEQLYLQLLSQLLIGNPTSILYQRLIESQIGKEVISDGLSNDYIQALFVVGLKGILPENINKVEDIILNTLTEYSTNLSFSQGEIEAALSSLEFHLKEFNTGSYPRGLSFLVGTMSDWIYNRDPIESMKYNDALNNIKNELIHKKNGKNLFSNLIKKYLINNNHRSIITMKPDILIATESYKNERKELDDYKSSLNKDDINKLINDTKEFDKFRESQDNIEDLNKIPRLSLDDIDRKQYLHQYDKKIYNNDNNNFNIHPGYENNIINLNNYTPLNDNVNLLTHDLDTNNILYLDIAFKMDNLLVDELKLLSLFSRMIFENGTSKLNDSELIQEIGTKTGGISPSISLLLKSNPSGSVIEQDNILSYFILSGKVIKENISHLYKLLQDILFDSKLNNKNKAYEILLNNKMSFESNLSGNGTQYALKYGMSSFGLLPTLNETISGITSYEYNEYLLENFDNKWDEIYEKLENIRNKLISKNGLILNLAGNNELLNIAENESKSFIKNIESFNNNNNNIVNDWNNLSLIKNKNTLLLIPTQTNFVTKVLKTWNPNEIVHGSDLVVTRHLKTNYLWTNIRTIGGAYGANCATLLSSGLTYFTSYRDPNIIKTLDYFDMIPSYIQSKEFSDDEITQTIIGTIGGLDSPRFPDQQARESLKRFMIGETEETRQRLRDEIFETNINHFYQFGERLDNTIRDSIDTVVTSEEQGLEYNKVMPPNLKYDIKVCL